MAAAPAPRSGVGAVHALEVLALAAPAEAAARFLRWTGTSRAEGDALLRRFEGRRPAAIVWGWLKIHALFHLGVAPSRLARLYDTERRRQARRHRAPGS